MLSGNLEIEFKANSTIEILFLFTNAFEGIALKSIFQPFRTEIFVLGQYDLIRANMLKSL